MRKLILGLAAAAVMSACAGDRAERREERREAREQRREARYASGGGGGVVYAGGAAAMVALQVRNASPQTICYLYISPVSDPNWGPDQLGSHVINPGEVYTFNFQAGQWDIKGDDCQHNQLIYMRNVTIAANAEIVLQ